MTTHKKRIAFLGPRGTFSEEAALLYAPEAEFVPFSSHTAIAQAVATGMAEEGIVAIENSLDGAVTETVDLLIHDSKLSIRYEIILPIVQCLLVKEDMKVEDIAEVFSHPSALGQCRRFLEGCLPSAHVQAALSTTAAVEQMLEHGPAAAIGPRRSAEIYGVMVLADNIQDSSTNETRFVVLAETDHEPTGRDKTSLCFSFTEDRPGSLVRVLQAFSTRNINLARIESRPAKETLGKYIFLADLEGHRQEKAVGEALEEVRLYTDPQRFKIFGSYPRFNGNGH